MKTNIIEKIKKNLFVAVILKALNQREQNSCSPSLVCFGGPKIHNSELYGICLKVMQLPFYRRLLHADYLIDFIYIIN